MNLFKGAKFRLILIVLLLLFAFAGRINAAPKGGEVTAGKAEINHQENTTDINQSTDKAAINWQSFDVNADEMVNFNQPGVNSITLNRVIGNERSVINGALNANGQVWVLNSNGVLFGKDASVNTSGLIASTKELNNQDFMEGNYNFKGSSEEGVINKGRINIKNSGYAALLGKEVINKGLIKAELGEVHLKGGKEFSLNLNGNSLVNLRVEKGELNALVENKEAIRANGGKVYLTTNAVDELLKGVVNNEGIVEAQTIADVTGEKNEGKIEIFAHGGTANVGGKLTTAKGEGFIETSGKKFNITKDAEIISGHWLIDPVNVTIDSTLAGNIESGLSNGDVTVNTAGNGSSDVTILDANKSGSEGDIIVDAPITWSTANKLTLDAYKDIIINQFITANGGGQLALYYGQGAVNSGNTATYEVNAPINLEAGENFFTKLGSDGNEKIYQVITDLGNQGSTTGNDLQGIKGNLDGNYVLGADIDASNTSTWSSENHEGFIPLGIDEKGHFKGIFDGLDHTIKKLHIGNKYDIGLFGEVTGATIKNIGLDNVSMKNLGYRVGGLIGTSHNSTIINCYIEGSSITGGNQVGGLIGKTESGTIIKNSYSTVDVTGTESNIGGLVGKNVGNGVIKDSYATGTITGEILNIGGLVGELSGSIENSYATGNVIGNGVKQAGGLVGTVKSGASISDSYATGDVTGNKEIGGLVGSVEDNNYAAIENSFYNIDQGMINGEKKVTAYGIYENQFNDWINDKKLNVDDYFNIADDGAYLISGIDNMKDFLGFSMEEGYKFRLKSNIDFANHDFPSKQDYFIPVLLSDFDGNQQQLSNLKIKNLKEERILANRGLFGYAEDVEIKDLNTTGFTIDGLYNVGSLVGKAIGTDIKNVHAKELKVEGTSYFGGAGGTGGLVGTSLTSIISGSSTSGSVTGQDKVGGLVGGMKNNSRINDSYSNAEVISQASGKGLGGLVGLLFSSTIKNSYATNDVTGGAYVGGLIGLTQKSKIENSYSTAIVNMADLETKPQYFGGLVGAGFDYTIDNSYAIGTVDAGKANYVGGLVGASNLGTIKTSYATNNVIGNMQVGGLVGFMNTGPRTIENSYSTGTVTGTDKVGGLVGTLRNEAIKNSYTISKVNSDGDNIGGLVGYQAGDNTINDSYYNKDINPNMKDEDNYGRTTDQLQDVDFFKKAAWNIVEDSAVESDYPVLGDGDATWKISSDVVESEDATQSDQTVEKVIANTRKTANENSPQSDEIVALISSNDSNQQININRQRQSSPNLSSTPVKDEPTDKIYLSEIKSKESEQNQSQTNQTQASQFEKEDERREQESKKDNTEDVVVDEVRVSVSEDSLVQIVDGGVSLPEGIDQIFYIVDDQ
ncbi:GLUG motif-containing protein [Sporohalobacter salinus]|uniref:GLUG motif-containing protein n=1 Tax=Sporohalobacter salinus TaxID=1494606 RepID=UPI00196097D8|nr:GLUG motif-containing protein [Sporohalobacter salinus]MBM7624511.1 filamentous hemagglutinin family protein [Sporohalobacter salinus]